MNHKDEDFQNYLFVDETTVRLLEVPLYHIRKVGSQPDAIPATSKIRKKVNIWGGISYKGPTTFVVKTLI